MIGTIAGANSFPSAPSFAMNWQFDYLNAKKEDGSLPYQMDSITFQTSHVMRDFRLRISKDGVWTIDKTIFASTQMLLFSDLNLALSLNTNCTFFLETLSGAQVAYFHSNVYPNNNFILDSVSHPSWCMAFHMIGRYEFSRKAKIISIY